MNPPPTLTTRDVPPTALLLAILVTACGEAPPDEGTMSTRSQLPEREAPAAIELPPLEGPVPVRYVDATEEAGIDFYFENGRSEDKYYIEFMSGGAIFFDADGDDDPDLYLLNGHRIAAAPEDPPPRNAFYVNDGTGHFTDATEGSGLGDTRYGVAVCGADYDNDGDIDLYVNNFDEANALFRNEGDGTFVDVAAEAGVEGVRGFGSSCAFADVDNDGWVDLYVGYCLDHTKDNNKVCQWPRRDGQGDARRYCNPENYGPLPDILFKSRGDGTFEDVSASSGITGGLGRTLGVAFADYDDDGDQDLFVSCDRTTNLYYDNVGRGHFQEIAMRAGTALSEYGQKQAGMGLVSGDYDGDGRIDVAVTYFEQEWNAFYRNVGGHMFVDSARPNGTAPSSFPLLAWGIELFDADNDGDLDCYVANGHIMDNVHLFREPVAGYEQPNLFYLNRGGGLFESLGTRAGPALSIEKVSRGLCVADIDLDGDVDALVVNLHERPDLLRNDADPAGRHWLAVRTVGTKSNRSGIGARVVARLADGRQVVREVRTGQSYLSQSDLVVHLGLGDTSVVPHLEVRWPSGLVTVLEDVAADQRIEVVEDAE